VANTKERAWHELTLTNLLRIRHGIIWLVDALLVVSVLSMVVIAAIQIITRNVFDAGVIWAEPLLRMLVFWAAMLGAVVASRRNKHITIDVFSRYIPDYPKAILAIITHLFTAIISVLLAYHSARFVIMERDAATIAFASIPSWMVQLILPLSFTLIALRYFYHVYLHTKNLVTRSNQP